MIHLYSNKRDLDCVAPGLATQSKFKHGRGKALTIQWPEAQILVRLGNTCGPVTPVLVPRKGKRLRQKIAESANGDANSPGTTTPATRVPPASVSHPAN